MGGGLVANVQHTSLLSRVFILHDSLRHDTNLSIAFDIPTSGT